MEALRHCRLVGGATGVSRLVTNVNVMEVPDVLPWVNAGELLLTTAYAIINDAEAQRSLIPALAQKGLAGLGIKTKRYMEQIPPEMVRQADEHSFPLIELSPDTSHPRTIHAVMDLILSKQASILDRAVRVHERLIEVTARGGDLDQIAATLAELVENPVAIWDSAGARTGLATGSLPLAHAEMLAAAMEPPPQYLARISLIRQDRCMFDGRAISRVVVPVHTAEGVSGLIVAWGVQRELGPTEIRALELAVGTVATQLLTRRMLADVEWRYRNEFLHEWLGGQVVDEQLVIQRGRTLGWDLAQPFIPLMVIRQSDDRVPLAPVRNEETVQWIKRYLDRSHSDGIMGDRGESIVILLPALGTRSNPETVATWAAELRSAFRRRFPGLSLSIGIGSLFGSPLGAAQSVEEARIAQSLCEALNPIHQILRYSELGLFRLLYHVQGVSGVDRFIDEMLSPLRQYDQEHGTDLLQTLEVFLESGNLRLTAERLYTHYNTALYRINSIRKLLGGDLDDPAFRVSAFVALRLLRLKRGS